MKSRLITYLILDIVTGLNVVFATLPLTMPDLTLGR